MIRQKKLTHGQNKKIKKKGFSKSNILRSDILKHLVQVRVEALKYFLQQDILQENFTKLEKHMVQKKLISIMLVEWGTLQV